MVGDGITALGFRDDDGVDWYLSPYGGWQFEWAYGGGGSGGGSAWWYKWWCHQRGWRRSYELHWESWTELDPV